VHKPGLDGLKPKDLIGIPWRVAFALQADGWWLRQDIIWAKPNPMPESVTDRCTKAHEYIFLLTKSARYYYDNEAVKEAAMSEHQARYKYDFWPDGTKEHNGSGRPNMAANTSGKKEYDGTRNPRSVWTITTKPFKGAHFATFPPEIPTRCIKAGTSERGACSVCGAPRERVVEKGDFVSSTGDNRKPVNIRSSGRLSNTNNNDSQPTHIGGWVLGKREITPIGWQPTCSCNASTVPCIVLDPFAGAGTTLCVAKQLGRDYIGIELNPDYVNKIILPRLAATPVTLGIP
jgi:hypothetical protein